MTPRSIRRAAERKAAKLSRKQPNQSQVAANTNTLLSHEDFGVVNESQPDGKTPPSPRHCTGPTTPEGRAISCLNRLKHGLTGTFRVLGSESQSLFDELCAALRREHAPASPTETLLVDRMAEHIWFSQRAQGLQDNALLEGDEKSFALFLRYQTSNDRAFHRCLRELITYRRERQQFESQNAKMAAATAETHHPSTRRESLATPQSAPGRALGQSRPPAHHQPAAVAPSSNRKTHPQSANALDHCL